MSWRRTRTRARALPTLTFASAGWAFELVSFKRGRDHPSILISRGSGGHAYVFAELAYLMHRQGYNVFVMPRHGGHTIAELVTRHADALSEIARRYNDRIGVYAEGLGGFAAFYLALAHGPLRSIALQNSQPSSRRRNSTLRFSRTSAAARGAGYSCRWRPGWRRPSPVSGCRFRRTSTSTS